MEAREQQFSYGGAYGGGESGYVLPAAAYSAGAPPQPSQPHYLLAARHRSLCSTATTAYDEVTAAQSGGGGGGGGGGAAPARPRGGSDIAGTGVCTRRRKCLSGSDLEEDTGDEEHSQRAPDGKKQNHSEIEKRRRDKMNTYITELSSMVPMCGAMARKLDKLTVLRMAVQHLKRVRGAAHAFPEGRHRPAFLSERELKMLILQAAEGFLFVADCDRGRVLYVSESVARALHYSQPELLGQSLFDLLHPKDVAKVKEQLSASDLSPRERLIDATTMLPVRADVAAGASRLSPGARRSFFCRMKRKPGTRRELAHAHAHVKQEHDTGPGAHPHRKLALTERKYSVVQCTGYLKAWSGGVAGGDAAGGEPAEPGEEGGGGAGSGAGGALSCLVAVGRTLPELSRRAADSPSTRRLQFVSRHATDGKFIYVDQRATPALGFLPQELLGTSLYEYAAPAQVGELARLHKAALLTAQPQSTPPYAFRRKNGSYARLQTDWKPFRNPWTKELECLVANNTLLDLCADQLAASPPGAPAADDDTSRYFTRPGAETETEVQRLIHCQLESHKIGSAIAEEVLRRRADSPPAAPRGPPLHSDLLHDLTAFAPAPASPLAHQLQVQASASGVAAAVETSLLPHFAHVRNNVTLSAAAPGEEEEEEEVLRSLAAPAPAPAPAAQRPPPPAPAAPPDGNDEAAMAVIMSLLEADAGLGGPVDFSGLPWPLP